MVGYITYVLEIAYYDIAPVLCLFIIHREPDLSPNSCYNHFIVVANIVTRGYSACRGLIY